MAKISFAGCSAVVGHHHLTLTYPSLCGFCMSRPITKEIWRLVLRFREPRPACERLAPSALVRSYVGLSRRIESLTKTTSQSKKTKWLGIPWASFWAQFSKGRGNALRYSIPFCTVSYISVLYGTSNFWLFCQNCIMCISHGRIREIFFWGGKVIFPDFFFSTWNALSRQQIPILVDPKQILVVLKSGKKKKLKKKKKKKKKKKNSPHFVIFPLPFSICSTFPFSIFLLFFSIFPFFLPLFSR